MFNSRTGNSTFAPHLSYICMRLSLKTREKTSKKIHGSFFASFERAAVSRSLCAQYSGERDFVQLFMPRKASFRLQVSPFCITSKPLLRDDGGRFAMEKGLTCDEKGAYLHAETTISARQNMPAACFWRLCHSKTRFWFVTTFYRLVVYLPPPAMPAPHAPHATWGVARNLINCSFYNISTVFLLILQHFYCHYIIFYYLCIT